jgi:UDP-N-acetyl-D-galactosamine dehydrogenase
MIRRGVSVAGARALVLGLTFKENCPDLRNTRVVDIVAELQSFGAQVDVHDPWIDPAEAEREYGIVPVATPEKGAYDAIVVAVGHRQFRELGIDGIRALGRPGAVVYDVKYLFPADAVDGRL